LVAQEDSRPVMALVSLKPEILKLELRFDWPTEPTDTDTDTHSESTYDYYLSPGLCPSISLWSICTWVPNGSDISRDYHRNRNLLF